MDGHLNVGALYKALNSERKARGDMSWRTVAKEAGVSPSTLSRLGNGYRPDVDAFAKLVQWLGVPAENFFAGQEIQGAQPDLVTELAPLLRARKDLTQQDVEYLEDIISAAMRRFGSERRGA
jgi:transcriptional regulator with XRE-family HTH domain